MSHFTKDFIKFLKDLSKNNNREWFNENKKRYESSVKEPFFNFIDEMITRINMDDPSVTIEPKDAIFRIYKDVRFSKDKSPYKTQASAVISPGGRKDLVYPGMYIEINHIDFKIYGGLYQLDKNQLQAVREHITANLLKFSKLLNDKKFKTTYGEISGEKNKRVPPEFAEALAKQPLIANKQFYFFDRLDHETILKPNLTDIVMKHYHTAKPINTFLKEALGLN
ncbi:MAG: DUF2461 domain-containing protein [Bacteroidetes bacterium]|nr:DUF2461 domain-containing protein [Bacteroidota bacterium]